MKERKSKSKLKLRCTLFEFSESPLHFSAYSNELNNSRLQVLKARDDEISKLYQESHKRLSSVTKNPASYKKLLHDLIVQVISFHFDSL